MVFAGYPSEDGVGFVDMRRLNVIERFQAWRRERERKTAEELGEMSAEDREAMQRRTDMPPPPNPVTRDIRMDR
jgi:hypothetical protein